MTSRMPSRMATPAGSSSEAGAPSGARAASSSSWTRGLLKLSIGREKSAGAGGDRAGAASAQGEPDRFFEMRAELGARLLVHDPATQAVHNLYLVHEQLGGAGWQGVETLPRQVMGRALAEAEMLDIDEPSPLMAAIVERLRTECLAADRRAELHAIAEEERAWEVPDVPEVSEATHEEYELMERSWIGTVPSGLHRQEREL